MVSPRFAAVLAVLLAAFASPPQAPPKYDLAIVGGDIIDGSGAPARRADVAVKDGMIAAIGRVPRRYARDVIDAAGMVVAPGFIDVHTHADNLAEHPEAENFVRMGVTTLVAGNCGSSAVDIGEALNRVRQTGAAVNFATLIGHNAVRAHVMGTADRAPSLPELSKMKSLVWRGMTDGAVGFSTGLQYVPGIYARSVEIIELARVAGSAGGVYASHMRNEGSALEESVAETIRIGAAAGARVQISHLKVDSPSHWGASARALELVEQANKRGTIVRADQYAYTAASSSLGIRFPSWAREGGEGEIVRRLNEPATWTKIRDEMRALLAERGLSDLSFAVVASHGANPALNGLSMKEVAVRLKGSGSADAQLEAAREMMLAGGASMVYHFMSDADVDRIMRHPFVGVASDASILTPGRGVPHPRGNGNNARVLGEYVRKRKVIALPEAIRKMTSLPASQFRFDRRGLVEIGMAADLVVFDPATVADRATYEAPHAYSAGLPHVVVNGVPVLRDNQLTRARPGLPLTLESKMKNEE
jgi:N-acyl-D-amino-acid deacylase